MCKFPLVGYWTPQGLKVTSRDEFYQRFSKKIHFLYDEKGDMSGECYSKRSRHLYSSEYMLFVHPVTGVAMRPLQIPCGRCMECRLAYAREWADRLVMEQEYWADDVCYFLTLTYNDECLPLSESRVPTLSPLHVKYFMMRLRSYFADNFKYSGIRFYLCGEYGANTHRPHYHIIVFNCPLELLGDLQYKFKNFQGDHFFVSEKLDDIWGKGFVVASNVTWDTCCYTARYVTKKIKDLSDSDDSDSFVKEFSRSSNRPGIGAAYWASHAEKIIKNRGIQLKSGRFAPIPRYFKKMLKESDEDAYYELQMSSIDYANLRYDQLIADCPYADETDYLLASDHDFKKNVLSKLIRSLDI